MADHRTAGNRGGLTRRRRSAFDTLPGPLFRDRLDAGRVLAYDLADERDPDAVVIGLARGGAQVAAEVARLLGLPLDTVAVRKIRHPRQPEYALGAVTPAGGVYLRGRNGLTDTQLADALEAAQNEAHDLDRRLHGDRAPLELAGKRVLVVDDGLATGATMVAALRWARTLGASRLVAAAPVASTQGVALLDREADRVACPYELMYFGAVGNWYRNFEQVDEDEVRRLLDAAATRETPRHDGTAADTSRPVGRMLTRIGGDSD